MKDKLKGSADGYVWVWEPNQDRSLTYGFHEATLKPFIQMNSNSKLIAVNVGAHCGAWAIRLPEWNRRVYAYEADPKTFEVLKKNVEYNSLEDVIEVKPAAVWDRAGIELDLFSGERETNGSTYVKEKALPYILTNDSSIRQTASEFGVGGCVVNPLPGYLNTLTTVTNQSSYKTVTLDDEFIDRGKVGLILIDVEGAELNVLSGGQELLQRDRPNLIVELHEGYPGAPENLKEKLMLLLGSLDYDVQSLNVYGEEVHLLCRPNETLEEFVDKVPFRRI